jgi:quercetin dioxygenase-like cupin family protein
MGERVETVVRVADRVPFRPVTSGTAAEMQVLIGVDDAAPHFAMRRFRMQAGGGMPLHTNAVEHEQYVLRGRARVTTGKDIHEVSAGNVLYIPAGVPHSYEVLEGPFEFLCLVPNLKDEIKVLEKGC